MPTGIALCTFVVLFTVMSNAACEPGKLMRIGGFGSHPVQRGATSQLELLLFDCRDGRNRKLYVAADGPSQSGPFNIRLVPTDGLTLQQVTTPGTKLREFQGTRVSSFQIRRPTIIKLGFTVTDGVPLGLREASLEVTYQAMTKDHVAAVQVEQVPIVLDVTDKPALSAEPKPSEVALGIILLPVYVLYCGTLAWVIHPCGS